MVEERNPEKLSLALEPESAAVFCQKMTRKEVAEFAQPETAGPYVSDRYMVVDIGGGTVDITSYQANSQKMGHIQLLHEPEGLNDCGGSCINRAFLAYLEKLVEDPGFKRYVGLPDNTAQNLKHSSELLELINVTFENVKRDFGVHFEEDRDHVIALPYNFMTIYAAKLEETVKSHTDVTLDDDDNMLALTHRRMEMFYDVVVPQIQDCVAKIVAKYCITTLYLVGGFGGCKYIYHKVKERLCNSTGCQIIVPLEHDSVVVKGAVICQRYPEYVWSRVADMTYGRSIIMPFDTSTHERHYCIEDDEHKKMCKDLFQVIIERGETISQDELYTAISTPLKYDQKNMLFEIFCTKKLPKDVWYVRNRNRDLTVMHLGNVVIDLGDNCEKDRPIEITLDFSHTEIQVRAYDKRKGTEIKSVLDFLHTSEEIPQKTTFCRNM